MLTATFSATFALNKSQKKDSPEPKFKWLSNKSKKDVPKCHLIARQCSLFYQMKNEVII